MYRVLSTGNGYGVPDDIVFSFPVRCAGGDWRIVEGLKVAPKTRELWPATVSELVEERSQAVSFSHL
jgi:malate/lactate dehydrogenase